MTVKELHEQLAELISEGKGDLPVTCSDEQWGVYKARDARVHEASTSVWDFKEKHLLIQ